MTLSPEQATALAGALVAAVLAFLEYLRRQLADNTKKTEQAKTAANNAEQTSNGRLTEQIRLNQNLQAENFHLRRLLDALEMDQQGLAALSNARARLETLRAMRPDSAAANKEQIP